MQNCYVPCVETTAMNTTSCKMDTSERLDGRKSDEHRSISMQMDVVGNAVGSAYVEFNQTKVICAVYGPRADTRRTSEYSDTGKLVCDVKYSPFAIPRTKRKNGQQPDEIEMSVALQQALSPAILLEKLPKSRLDLFVWILEADGSELGAAITCGSLALANAAIEMRDLVAGCSAVSLLSMVQLLLVLMCIH